MKRFLYSSIAALSFILALPTLAHSHCSCDKKCIAKCQSGKSTECACQGCSCSKGKGCKHGKCGSSDGTGTGSSKGSKSDREKEKISSKPTE